MSSKIRKMDTEKLNKYLRIIDKCYIGILLVLMVAVILFAILTVCGYIIEIKIDIVIPIIGIVFAIAAVALIFDSISKKISKELSFRKGNETIAILSSTGTKKVRLNDLESVNLNQLLEICEAEATYNSETDTILITFIITGDEGSTKISKTVEFKKEDNIISKIEIV